jgi:hypothetical protein
MDSTIISQSYVGERVVEEKKTTLDGVLGVNKMGNEGVGSFVAR